MGRTSPFTLYSLLLLGSVVLGFFFLFAFWATSEEKLKTEETEGGSQIASEEAQTHMELRKGMRGEWE